MWEAVEIDTGKIRMGKRKRKRRKNQKMRE